MGTRNAVSGEIAKNEELRRITQRSKLSLEHLQKKGTFG